MSNLLLSRQVLGKSVQNSREKNLKKIQEDQIHTKISKIKTEYKHDETYDLPSFMANPAAQMLKNFGKLVCASLFFLFPLF